MKEAVGAQRKLDMQIQGNNDQKWKSIFAANKMASIGMNLQFIAHKIKNGDKVAMLCKEMKEEATEK